jgi:capsular exopolysaccharide synthesis family protein
MNWLKDWFPEKPKPAAPRVESTVTQIVGSYLGLLEVRPIAGTSLVTVKFTTTDPQLSARLANAHGYSYVHYGVDLRAQTNDEAQVFLQQKLTELKERIEQSEAALNRYRKDKGILSVDEKDNVIVDRLLDLNKTLTGAEGERIGLEAQMMAIRGRNYDELPVIRNSAVINGLKSEVTKLDADYASLAKDFRPGYPALDFAKTRLDDARARLAKEIQNEVRAVETAYSVARNKEAQFRTSFDDQKKTTLELKDAAVQYAILAREADTNRQLYDGVLQRLKEIGVAAEVRNSNIYVMGKAVTPGSSSYPSRNGILMRALLLGLAVGVGLAFLLDQLDNTLKNPEEAERFTRLPSLGVVPDFNLLRDKRIGYVSKIINSARAELRTSTNKELRPSVLENHPLSLTTEAYRALRSSLLLSQAGGPPQITLMTSPMIGDGKTTTLVNTAIVFAQLGIRVLIIDGDLRRPRCHIHLKMENGAGLTECLTRQIDMEEAIRPTSAENLSLISAGAIPPNPAELLSSGKMAEVLNELRDRFEFIFIDSSPVMAVSDAVFLSTMVDGTLLVINRRTPKPLVRKTLAKLRTPHTKMLGLLLNRVDVRTGEYGYYNHYYNYFQEYHGEAVPEAT